MDASQILDLVASLQGGVDNDEGWLVALDAVAEAFGAVGLFLGSTRADGSHFELSGHRVAPEWSLMINGALASREANPVYAIVSDRLRAEPGKKLTGPIRMSDAMPVEKFRASPIFQQVMLPAGYEHVMAMTLDATPTSAISLTIVRAKGEGDFEEKDMRLADRLGPHLLNALRLRQRMATAASGELLLDSIGHPVLLLSGDCELMHTNRMGRELLAGKSGLQLQHGQLCGADVAASRKIRAAVAEAGRAARGASLVPPPVISIDRPSGAPLVLRALPLQTRQQTAVDIGGTAVVALMVHDPDRFGRPTAELLADGLGISKAEAAVATRIWLGDNVHEAAAALGLSINTVKTHLKTIYDRLDLHRQSDLIRRIAFLLAELGGGFPIRG